jgi:glucokinase
MGLTLGVDVGGSVLKWVLLKPDHTLVDQGHVPTPEGPAAVVDTIASVHRAVVERIGADVERIGVAMPGHVDRAAGSVLFVPALTGGWPGFPLGPAVRDRTGVEVGVVNDARAFGLAELRLGAGRGRTDVLFVVLGTGVGGAIAHRGRILVGPRDNLGDIGHMTIDPAGPPCPCGGVGCLEMFAGARALVAASRRSGGPDTSAQDVATAAHAGDPAAVAAFDAAGHALGRGLGAVLAAFGLDTVIVGGGVAAALPLLRPAVEAELTRLIALLGKCTVAPAHLGPHAGAAGAALWTAEGAG